MKYFIIFGLFLIWQTFEVFGGAESDWKWEKEILDGSLIQIYRKDEKDAKTEMYLNVNDSLENLVAVDAKGEAASENFLTTYKVVYTAPKKGEKFPKTFKLKVEHVETLEILQEKYREIFPFGECNEKSYKNARNIFPDIKLMEYCQLGSGFAFKTEDNWMSASDLEENSDLTKKTELIDKILKYIDEEEEDTLVPAKPMLKDIQQLLKDQTDWRKEEKKYEENPGELPTVPKTWIGKILENWLFEPAMDHWNRLKKIYGKNPKYEESSYKEEPTVAEMYKRLSWDILQQVELSTFPQQFEKYANYKAFHKLLMAYDGERNAESRNFLLEIFGDYPRSTGKTLVQPKNKWFGIDPTGIWCNYRWNILQPFYSSYRGKTKIVNEANALKFNIPDKNTDFALTFHVDNHDGYVVNGNTRFVFPTGEIETKMWTHSHDEQERWNVKIVLDEKCDKGDDYNFDFTGDTAVPGNSIVEIYRPYDHDFERFEAIGNGKAQQCLGMEEINAFNQDVVKQMKSIRFPNRCTANGEKCKYRVKDENAVATATCKINVDDKSVWKNSFGEDIWYMHKPDLKHVSYFVQKTKKNAFKLISVDVFKKKENCMAYIHERLGKDFLDVGPAISFINYAVKELAKIFPREDLYEYTESDGNAKITERLNDISSRKMKLEYKRPSCVKWYFEHLHLLKQTKKQLKLSVNTGEVDDGGKVILEKDRKGNLVTYGEFRQEPGSGFIKVVDDESTLFLSTNDPSNVAKKPQKMCVKVIDKRYRMPNLSLVKESELPTSFPSKSLAFRSVQPYVATEKNDFRSYASDVKGSRMSPMYAVDKDKVEPEQKFELDEDVNCKMVVVFNDKTKVTQLTSSYVMDIDQEGYAKKNSVTKRLDGLIAKVEKRYDQPKRAFQDWKNMTYQAKKEQKEFEKRRKTARKLISKLKMKVDRAKFLNLKETGKMLEKIKSVVGEEPPTSTADVPAESAEPPGVQTEAKTKTEDKTDGWDDFKASYTALRGRHDKCWEVRRDVANDKIKVPEREREVLIALRKDAKELLEQSIKFVKDDKQQEIRNVLERENDLENDSKKKEEDELAAAREKIENEKTNEQSWITFLKSQQSESLDETEVVKSAFVDVELTPKNLESVKKVVEEVSGSARLQTTRTFEIHVKDEKATPESVLEYCKDHLGVKCELVEAESGRRRLIDSFTIEVIYDGTISEKDFEEKMSKLKGDFGVKAIEIKKEIKIQIILPPKSEYTEDEITNILKKALAIQDNEGVNKISNSPEPEDEEERNDSSSGTSPGMYFVYIGLPALAVGVLVGLLFCCGCRCTSSKKRAAENLPIANPAKGADYNVSAFESSVVAPGQSAPWRSEEMQQHPNLSRNEGLVLQTRDVSLHASEMNHESSVPHKSVEVSEKEKSVPGFNLLENARTDPDQTSSPPTDATPPTTLPTPPKTTLSNGVCQADDICALEKNSASEKDKDSIPIGSDLGIVPGSASLGDVEAENDTGENISGQISEKIFSGLDSVTEQIQETSNSITEEIQIESASKHEIEDLKSD